MTRKLMSMVAVAVLASLGAAAASAQDPDEKLDKIVLEQKAGSVMTSTGAQYESANLGKLLINGESMMLGDASEATVVYYYLDRNGNLRRKCVEKYKGPETFIIDDSCKAAAYWWDGSKAASAGVIIGAGVVGALILNGMHEEAAPISTGSNRTP